MKFVTSICGVALALFGLVTYLAEVRISVSAERGRMIHIPRGVATVGDADNSDSPCLGAAHEIPGFDTDKAELSATGGHAVVELVDQMLGATCINDPSGTECSVDLVGVELLGHTDERLTRRYGGNDLLSLHRAQSTEYALLSHGIRIVSVTGLAATQPAPDPVPDTRSTADRWADDRRVTVRLWCGV